MKPLPEPSDFTAWLLSRKKWLLLPAYGVLANVASSIITAVPRALAWPWLTTALLFVQLLTIAFLMLFAPPALGNREVPRATIVAQQFAASWRRVWVFWSILFLGLTIEELCQTLGTQNIGPLAQNAPHVWTLLLFQTGLNALSNLSTLALFICYFILSELTVEEVGDGTYHAKDLPWDIGLVIVVLVTAADLLIRVNVVGQWHFLPWAHADTICDWLTGLASGLALALLVGRLDSKALELPVWSIVPLYAYAVIQTGWPAFETGPAVKAMLLTLALGFKCLFFVLVYWLLRSGTLLFYIDKLNEIHGKATEERASFLARVQRNISFVRDNVAQVGPKPTIGPRGD